MQDTLGAVQEVVPSSEWDVYDGPGPRKRVRAGRYSFRLPTITTNDEQAWTRTNSGYLQVVFTATIADGPFAGEELRYTRFSTQPFKNGKGNFLGKLIRSLGYNGSVPQTDEDYKAIIASLAGQTFQSDVDTQYYCKGCKSTLVRNEAEAPKDENGEPVAYVECGRCIDPETGSNRRVWGNAQLTFPVSPFVRK